MVQHTTVALIQSIVAIVAIVINASLQANGLAHLNKTTVDNQTISSAKQSLLAAVVTQFIAAALMVTVAIVILVYKEKIQEHTPKLLYAALIISGAMLFISGSLGATVAVRLQCYRSDPNVQSAWEMASISSVIGILGAIVLLLTQIFIRKDTIKDIAQAYLQRKKPAAAVPVPAAAVAQKPVFAPKPVYQPLPQKKPFE